MKIVKMLIIIMILLYIPQVFNDCISENNYYVESLKILDNERKILFDDITKIKSDINMLKQQIEIYKQNIDSLNTSNQTIMANIESSKSIYIKNLEILENEKKILLNEITNIKGDVNLLRQQNENYRQIIDSLNTSKQTIISTIESLKSNQLNIFSTIDNFKMQFVDIQRDMTSLKSSDSKSLFTEKKYSMYSKDIIVYRDIFNALQTNTISKIGNPYLWDETTYSNTLWNFRKLIRIGFGYQADKNGMLVNVPEGYNIIWICHLSDRRIGLRIASKEYPNDNQIMYGFGQQNLNELYPDGSVSDTVWNFHKWMPLYLYRTGIHYIICQVGDCWLSGIAFGKNIWNHSKIYSVALLYGFNGGDPLDDYPVWGNDEMCFVPNNTTKNIYVPIISNGKDKLLYFVSHNDAYDTQSYVDILVNDRKIERFKSTYLNPFSLHHNSKIFQSYYASKLTKDIYKENDRFVKVTISSTFNYNFFIRAFGTHDLE